MSSILGGFAGGGSGAIGAAAVELVLDNRQYEAALAKTQGDTEAATAAMSGDFEGLQQSVSSGFSATQAAAVGAGAAVAAAIGAAINVTQEWASTVRSLQTITGQTAEDASSLAGAARLLGVDLDSLNVGLTALSRNMINGSANFDKYGIAVRDATGQMLPFDAVLANVQEAFLALPEGPERAAFATNVFGKSGRDLIPILSRGAEGLAELRGEAEAFGLVMSQDALDASKELTVAQRELGVAVQGAAIALGTTFVPIMTTVVEVVTDAVRLLQVVPRPVLAAGAAFLVLNAALVVLRGTMAVISANVGMMGNAIKALVGGALNPYVLAVGATVAAIGLFVAKQHEAAQRVDALTQAIEADSGALGENTRALVAHRLEAEGVLAAAQQLGIGLDTVVDAALGEAGAMAEVNGVLDEYLSKSIAEQGSDSANAALDLRNAFETLPPEIQAATDAAQRQTEALGETADATDPAAEGLGEVADAMEEVTTQAERNNQAMREWRSGVIDSLRDTFGTMENVEGVWKETVRSFSQGAKEAGRDAERFRRDLQKLNQQHLGDAWESFEQFLIDNPGKLDAYVRASDSKQQEFRQQWRETNGTISEQGELIRRITGKVNEVPDQKVIRVNVHYTYTGWDENKPIP